MSGFRVAEPNAVEAEYYYRFYDVATEHGANVYLQGFRVKSRTAKGVWLDLGLGEKRFVLNDARKQFACPTKDGAAVSFRRRKERQIGLLTSQLCRAKEALAQVPSLIAKHATECVA